MFSRSSVRGTYALILTDLTIGFLFCGALTSPGTCRTDIKINEGSIKSEQDRFQFAKAAIELRKQTRGGSVEETVVLAFGGGHGSAVHVTRKTKKRALFKVG